MLFTNVDESKFSVVSNILGTKQRFLYTVESSNAHADLSNLASIGLEHYPKQIFSDAPFYNNNTRISMIYL